jgi:UDP-GlcNAc:undecaprenyl-phosphate GlcNAc-1-phosphate transferase
MDKEMNDVVIAFLLSAIITACVIPWLIRFSLKLKMFDTHDLYRKSHSRLVSRMGGIGIFFGYFVIINVFADLSSLVIHALTASIIIVFCLGLKDDLLGGATPSEKIVVQFLATFTLIIFGGFKADPFIFISEYFQNWRFINVLLQIFAVLFIVNAFNFIDGINGLAGILGVAVNTFLGSYLVSWGDQSFGFASLILAGATSGFLIYNFIPNKVFMGDSGAMVIGLTTAATCLRFVSVSRVNEASKFNSPILIILALLIVPAFDVVRIFVIRGIQGKPFLVGDRNHIHHRLKDLGIRDLQAVFILMAFTLVSVTITIIGQNYHHLKIIFALGSLCLLCNTALSYFRGRRLFTNYKLSDVIIVDTFNKI